MSLPQINDHVPELMPFVRQLADDCEQGNIADGPAFIASARAFYTPAIMETLDRMTLNWSHMASFANQQTLIHVTSVLTALMLLPEYQNASRHDQIIMEWTVLFHDVAKEARRGEHDYIHAFRSAAFAGKSLLSLGFPASSPAESSLEQWFDLTYGAVIHDNQHQETIQDNTKLPSVLSGIAHIYGADTPAEWIIKAVLLHLSLAIDPTYPTLAPLTDQETKQYIDQKFYPFIKAMMLVDNDGWNLFDQEDRQAARQQTLAFFDGVKILIA